MLKIDAPQPPGSIQSAELMVNAGEFGYGLVQGQGTFGAAPRRARRNKHLKLIE